MIRREGEKSLETLSAKDHKQKGTNPWWCPEGASETKSASGAPGLLQNFAHQVSSGVQIDTST